MTTPLSSPTLVARLRAYVAEGDMLGSRAKHPTTIAVRNDIEEAANEIERLSSPPNVERAGAAMMRTSAGRRLTNDYTDDEIREFALAALSSTQDTASQDWCCAARKQSLPEPGECDWPMCGCDPYASKVIAALEESGVLSSTPDTGDIRAATIEWENVHEFGGQEDVPMWLKSEGREPVVGFWSFRNECWTTGATNENGDHVPIEPQPTHCRALNQPESER